MHRDYWLDKTSDFPDAVRQFGMQAIAAAYRLNLPSNPYFGVSKVARWAEAALSFWAGQQHRDGSFDEFYPYERGWVGPTAFTTFTAAETVQTLGDVLTPKVRERAIEAIARAARFIRKGDREADSLANHHAMACLAMHKAHAVSGEAEFAEGFEERWAEYLTYHCQGEGWSREYDGVDPGYLSASVSFLAKIYTEAPRSDMFEVLKESVETVAYFVGPDGSFGGSSGSRNTLHFYPHGFELLREEIPAAGAVADALVDGLVQGQLVAPEAMSDRYLGYRVCEFIQAHETSREKLRAEPPPGDYELPFQRQPFKHKLRRARVLFEKTPHSYQIANLAKGGVVRIFDASGDMIASDAGTMAVTQNGVFTTQWVHEALEIETDNNGWSVSGRFQRAPQPQLFTPMKQIIFRSILILISPIPPLSHSLKSLIRRLIITGSSPASLFFTRTFKWKNDSIEIVDQFANPDGISTDCLSVGDEFNVRYVPQSRYLQRFELGLSKHDAPADMLAIFHQGEPISLTRLITTSGEVSANWSAIASSDQEK